MDKRIFLVCNWLIYNLIGDDRIYLLFKGIIIKSFALVFVTNFTPISDPVLFLQLQSKARKLNIILEVCKRRCDEHISEYGLKKIN